MSSIWGTCHDDELDWVMEFLQDKLREYTKFKKKNFCDIIAVNHSGSKFWEKVAKQAIERKTISVQELLKEKDECIRDFASLVPSGIRAQLLPRARIFKTDNERGIRWFDLVTGFEKERKFVSLNLELTGCEIRKTNYLGKGKMVFVASYGGYPFSLLYSKSRIAVSQLCNFYRMEYCK